MSARDELKKVIVGYFGPTLAINAYKTPGQQDDELTDAILAAGYRKPRTITTAEELDALPVGAVIRDPLKRVFERWNLAGWQSAGATLKSEIALPAAVLYEGQASK